MSTVTLLAHSMEGIFFDDAYHTGTMKEMSEMTKVEKAGKFEKILKGVQSKVY